MNINKYLQSLGIVFPKNVDCDNLKNLVELGSVPIFMTKYDKTTYKFGYIPQYYLNSPEYYSVFNLMTPYPINNQMLKIVLRKSEYIINTILKKTAKLNGEKFASYLMYLINSLNEYK